MKKLFMLIFVMLMFTVYARPLFDNNNKLIGDRIYTNKLIKRYWFFEVGCCVRSINS